ncbi:AAA family ATPase [Arthrobacter cryoconiti]|uniref:CpaE family protein n=1 Tax=Arthrobacter cryoconiti TaxID=748907 RepID=A0ABV8R253_9MICC|nr:P-loop NTPase [Arthrobacter cryoconiti]MCC9068451.1 P-loop NTPase [Arthrobacter cryoconiti]
MRPITVVTVGDTSAGIVNELERGHGDVVVVRRCAELAQVLAVCQSGLAKVALVADGAHELTATLVDRLTAVGVGVVAVAGDLTEANRLQGIGVIAVVGVLTPETIASAATAAMAASEFSVSTGFAVPSQKLAQSESQDAERAHARGNHVAGSGVGSQKNTAGDGESDKNPDPAPAPESREASVASNHGSGVAMESAGGAALTKRGSSSVSTGSGSDHHGVSMPKFLSRWSSRFSRHLANTGVELVPGSNADSRNSPRNSSPIVPATIAVWGPIGSPGRTTFALNLAAELAVLGRSVMVIDADTYGSSTAAMLGLLEESASFAQACRIADQGTLGSSELAKICAEVVFSGGHFALLTGLTRSERWPELRSAAVERVLKTALLLVDTVVVDCGFCFENDEELSYDTLAPRRNAAALSVMAHAERIYAVGGADAISLPRLIRGLNELGESHFANSEASVEVVLNKVRKAAIGTAPLRALEQAWERFGPTYPINYFLPWDADTTERAVREGRLLLEVAPDSALRHAFVQIACAQVQRKRATAGAKATASPVNTG